jgi:(+)-trans-carveol dehydrogenase
MAGRVANKVAFVTGAARGQGRSHAVRLAEEGADIIAIDACSQIASVPYPLASSDQLEETGKLIEGLGRRVHIAEADVRQPDQLGKALEEGVGALGRLDIVCANAGILSKGATLDVLEEQTWQDMIDVNLTGVWHTGKVAVPYLRRSGGGSMILTSSMVGVIGTRNLGHYVAAKHGVIGLMKSFAMELAAENIRVNCVCPGNVNTDMLINPANFALVMPDLAEEDRTLAIFEERFGARNAIRRGWVEPVDISNAVLWLASDESRFVTGVNLPIDLGALAG